MDSENKISPKVHSGAASAAVGGGSAAVLLIWLLQSVVGVPEAQFTPDRVVALTSVLAWIGCYIGGYLKSS